MRPRVRHLLVLAALGVAPRLAVGGPTATVVGATRQTVFIDAGRAAGLTDGASWSTTIGGRPATVTVVALAQAGATVTIVGAPPPATGTVLALPDGLTPPAVVTPRPAPPPPPRWDETLAAPALTAVRARAAAAQPRPLFDEATQVRGEVSLSTLLSNDLGGDSTSWHDLALASQLTVEHGAWRYDHLAEARLAGSPELFLSPLQHARARLDVYLLRLRWAPADARLEASLGRQPAGPLGELGVVDGARGQVALGAGASATAFAGLRPDTDLGLSAAPRAGVGLGWQRRGPRRARADVGVAVDGWGGALDRAFAAAALTVATPTLLLGGDAVVDLTADAAGADGTRLAHAAVRALARRGRYRVAVDGGYDRPFLSRQLFVQQPDLLVGTRTYASATGDLALGGPYEVGVTARLAAGDGLRSLYVEALATRFDPGGGVRASVAPHLVLGDLVSQLGARGDVAFPAGTWRLTTALSVDHLDAAGQVGWLGVGRLGASRPLGERWRTSLSLEGAGGAGPPRALLFAQLAYRLGR